MKNRARMPVCWLISKVTASVIWVPGTGACPLSLYMSEDGQRGIRSDRVYWQVVKPHLENGHIGSRRYCVSMKWYHCLWGTAAVNFLASLTILPSPWMLPTNQWMWHRCCPGVAVCNHPEPCPLWTMFLLASDSWTPLHPPPPALHYQASHLHLNPSAMTHEIGALWPNSEL